MLDHTAIFGLQFLLSLIVTAPIATWYVAPWLAAKPVEPTLVPLILPHAYRHIGRLFLVPGMRLAVFIGALALVLFGAPSGGRAQVDQSAAVRGGVRGDAREHQRHHRLCADAETERVAAPLS